MSDRGSGGNNLGINYGNVVTWAIVVLGMGITYGTLYGTLRGSVDAMAEINNRQDQFVETAADLLTSLQLKDVQDSADLRQLREIVDRLQAQIDAARVSIDNTSKERESKLQVQVNELRNTITENRREIDTLRRSIDDLRRFSGSGDYMDRRPLPPDERDVREQQWQTPTDLYDQEMLGRDLRPPEDLYPPALRGGSQR